jgi:DNA invertase Pin-like site-specific DNA recombinase
MPQPRQDDSGADAARQSIRAAQYLRKSTDHQEHSTTLQSVANHAYAARHGIQIVRTYADEGKSGLSVTKRDALKQLLEDVQSGDADFSAILVYDVSRWGRFQDIDESGYHEHICKRAGIRVHYCGEPFVNDGSPFSVIIKNIKRAMAAEYSRELSAKVFAGQARLAAKGYAQGGAASYGLRRLLVDKDGQVRFELRAGDRKNIQTDRVVWSSGAPEEVAAVRWMFDTFVREKKTETEIAQMLNRRGLRAPRGGAWTPKAVRGILGNERYAGHYVWNRVSMKLRTAPRRNAPAEWIRAADAIEPVVPETLFAAAQAMIRERRRKLTPHERLEPLRILLREHRRLSCRLIARSPGVPSVSSYHRWFGGVIAAYKLIGYTKHRPHSPPQHPFRSKHGVTVGLSNKKLLELLREPLRKHGYLSTKIIDEMEGVPSAQTYRNRFGSLRQVYHQLADSPEHPGNRPWQLTQRRLNAFTYNLSDVQLLNLLRELVKRTGCLTQKIINANKILPSAVTYKSRVGSLARAYRLIGYKHVRGSGLLYQGVLSSSA